MNTSLTLYQLSYNEIWWASPRNCMVCSFLSNLITSTYVLCVFLGMEGGGGMHVTWFSRRDGVFSHELTVSCPGFDDEWEKTHISWKTMWNAFSPMLRCVAKMLPIIIRRCIYWFGEWCQSGDMEISPTCSYHWQHSVAWKTPTGTRHGHKKSYKDLNSKMLTSEWDSNPRPHVWRLPAIRRSDESSLGIVGYIYLLLNVIIST